MLGRALPALCCLWAFAGGCAGPPAPAAGDQFDGTYRGESHVVRGDGGFVCAPRDALASVTIRNGRFDYVYTNYELAAPAPIPVSAPASAQAPDPRIVKIQAGLKAFGNDDMQLDGVVGARTKAAIKEFQSLFGLPETGEPDEVVYVKMREIGLTN